MRIYREGVVIYKFICPCDPCQIFPHPADRKGETAKDVREEIPIFRIRCDIPFIFLNLLIDIVGMCVFTEPAYDVVSSCVIIFAPDFLMDDILLKNRTVNIEKQLQRKLDN